MNFAPKIGPLIAEFLSGFTVLILAYFTLPDSPSLLHDNGIVAIGALTVLTK